MRRLQVLKSALVGGVSVLTLAHPAAAKIFNVPGGDLGAALNSYMQQSGVQLVYMNDAVRGHKSRGAAGDYTEIAALDQILRGTGFVAQNTPWNAIGIVPQEKTAAPAPMRVAQAARRAPAAAPMAPTVETVVVTAQHKSENIQSVPISITAMSQQQLTERQIAAGPDLLRDVPNMNFGKTNFTGYSIELRGIGTQAISVTTDPAVAVAFNDIPFIRNHFFEQEFFDLQDVEVLRGPQGTLYGRNATAGVVNLKSALPTDTYEAMLSADIGNYDSRRYEGMLNLPIVGDTLDLRIAGEWTKRDGYSFDTETDKSIDGRDLWSGRITLGWKPASNVQTWLIWEHFSEDDDRLRSGKQLCKTAPEPTEIDGVSVQGYPDGGASVYDPIYYINQGCVPTSLYSPSAFEVPNGLALSYASAAGILDPAIPQFFNPYASTTQSTNLRDIQSALSPTYRAKNDTLELNTDYAITPALTLTSQTGYNNDFLWSAEDFNRFNTAPGIFVYYTQQELGSTWQTNTLIPDPSGLGQCEQSTGVCTGVNRGTPCRPAVYDESSGCYGDAIFCDPQVGCSDRLVAEDLSDERAWQFNQEFRLSSNFSGPLNFSAGANYLHYETIENYYVFINTITQLATSGFGGSGVEAPWIPGVSDNSQCIKGGFINVNPFAPHDPQTSGCVYIDPNPIAGVNNEGHNYFLSQNPYVLNSYAGFGEAYYNVAPDLKLIAGARWTDDQKHFLDIPSELLVAGYGYPVTGVVNQQWDQWTGRFAADWTPQLDFTDQTLIYGSFAHGYKAGGANPPGATLLTFAMGDTGNPIHPLTFKPEFIDAFELGTKNSLLDDSLTLNGDVFYYNYTGYQISEIVDRTAINNNYNATVRGGELEANWEPIPALKFSFSGGVESATANNGDSSIDLMDRTAGNPNWMVIRPFITQASNCILPVVLVAEIIEYSGDLAEACEITYGSHLDPITGLPYVPNPTVVTNVNQTNTIPPGYPGFNPASAPNNGEGFDKNLSGNQLPNAPHFTTSFTAEYSIPISDDWVGTLHSDFYWQSQSWARIFNDNPYDKLHGYSNVNLSLILTSANGWQVMGYVKNVFDTTAITGDFLNSDDTGLTTNVFLTDPRLYGIRVTKHLDQDDGFWGSDYSGYDLFTDLFSDADKGKPPLWIELGGQLSLLDDGQAAFAPSYMANRPEIFAPSSKFEGLPSLGMDETGSVSFEPDGSDWVVSASVQYGRSVDSRHFHQQTSPEVNTIHTSFRGKQGGFNQTPIAARFADTDADNGEKHLIADFQAGKDVGLGMFGDVAGSAIASLGVRFANFSSNSNFALKSDPDRHTRYIFFTNSYFGINHEKLVIASPYHLESASLRARRSFHGIGPSISWKASTPVAGSTDDGGLALDWGLNGAVLFGRQRASVQHHATAQYHSGNRYNTIRYVAGHYSANPVRSRMATVPNLGGFAGLSWQYRNAKVSFGYRADEFFGAMDGGIDTYKSYNRGFFGPYANISVGLGG